MAYIKKLIRTEQGRQRPQSEAIEAEFIPLNFNGERYIQINTAGSSGRQERGKQSQNIRFDRRAFDQLIKLGRDHFESK